MKRQDIKPGVLYASWRRRDYESPRPIVFLAAPSPDTLYYSPRRGSDGPCHVKFGSSGAWADVGMCAHMVESAVVNREWETKKGMPDPDTVCRED